MEIESAIEQIQRQTPMDPMIIKRINTVNTKGLKYSDISGTTTLIGLDYRNGASDVPNIGGSGKVNGNPASAVDHDIYFYKGLNDSDCIRFVVDLGLL